MSANRAPPLPLLPWLASALALGGALQPLPLGPWLTGTAAILVTCAGPRALPWLGFLVGGLLLGRAARPPESIPAVPTRVALRAEVLAPERPSQEQGQRTSVQPREPGCVGREWTLQEPAAHPPRHRGDLLRIQARAHSSKDGRRVTLLVEQEAQVQVLPAGAPGPWVRMRHRLDQCSRWLGRRLSELLAPRTRGLVDALLRGDISQLAPEERDRLRHCGVWHLLVISGLHVALLAHLLERLLRAHLGQGPASAVTLLVLGLFVLWSGARPPVVRAALTFLAGHIGRLFHRPTLSSPALALVFVLLVVSQPSTLSSAGTQLSFVAVLGISACMPYRFTGSPRGTGTGFDPLRPLMRALTVSTAASLATLPWCAWHFGQVAPWSPLTTLLLGPCLLLLAAGALGTVLLAPILPGVATTVGAGVNGVAGFCTWLLEWVDQWPGTPWWTAAPGRLFLVASIAALLLLQSRRPGLGLLVLVLAALADAGVRSGDTAHATLIDVGQGQCLWVHGDGRDWVVDAGAMTDAAEGEVRRTLARHGVTTVEALFLSHLDADHCRFAAGWVEQGLVRQLLLSEAHRECWQGKDPPSTVRSLHQAAKEAGIPVEFLARGDRVGPFQVHWPPSGRHFFADNDGSLVLSVPLGSGSLLVPGDTTSHALVELAALLPPQEILVLPHHGNPDPALASLLARIDPVLALASRSSPLEPGPVGQLGGASCAWLVTATSGSLGVAPFPGRIRCERLECHPATESE